jgi:hypothetical protein
VPVSRRSISAAEVPTPPKTYRVEAVSKLIDAAPRTVQKMMDSGILKAHRLPGTKYRRVYEPDLVRFMLEHELWVPQDMLARYREGQNHNASR